MKIKKMVTKSEMQRDGQGEREEMKMREKLKGKKGGRGMPQ